MVWPHPRDVILYARSSYYYDNMFIICLFLTFFLILKPYKGQFQYLSKLKGPQELTNLQTTQFISLR